MYIPKHCEENDIETLHSLIQLHPLGTWVTTAAGELEANHIPFYLKSDKDSMGNYQSTLMAHVAKANPIWKSISAAIDAGDTVDSGKTEENSIVIFQGVETYITPSWYPSKQQHGKAVPTWNYAVVHARGKARLRHEKDWLIDHLSELSQQQEANEELPWKLSDAPQDYIDRMVEHIVGIEIPIESLNGKWKMSQNLSKNDKLGVVVSRNCSIPEATFRDCLI